MKRKYKAIFCILITFMLSFCLVSSTLAADDNSNNYSNVKVSSFSLDIVQNNECNDTMKVFHAWWKDFHGWLSNHFKKNTEKNKEKHNECTVTFCLNYKGAPNSIEPQRVKRGECVIEPITPERQEYNFHGWFTDKKCTKGFDFSNPINKDIKLFAKWIDQSFDFEITIDTTNMIFDEESDSYFVGELSEFLKGTLTNSPAVTSLSYVIFNDKNQIVDNGDIVIGEEWSVTDVGLFVGLNKAIITAANDKVSKSKEILLNDLFGINYKNIDNSEGDLDEDGLPDIIEDYLGTDRKIPDTDGDGLTDFQEVSILDMNPLVVDSDNNGITDFDEDIDNDSISNGNEFGLGTDPTSEDSDLDDLTDGKEANLYKTSPVNDDTDGDGATDGWELQNSFDPLVYNDKFEVNESAGEVTEFNSVSAMVDVEISGKQVDSLIVEPVTYYDNKLISPMIAGFLGTAYEFNVDDSFDEAKITFLYDTNLGKLSDEFKPRVYCLNEETQELEELPEQQVSEGKVVVKVNHFSTYILLNKVEFDKVWECDIKKPLESDNGLDYELDLAFVIDYSSSMTVNDPQGLRKDVIINFINKLRENVDKAAIVKFIRTATLVQSLTSEKEALIDAIQGIEDDDGYSTNSGTNGSAGIKMALSELYYSTASNKYLVFLTDGGDNYSSYSYDELINEAIENNVIIYAIGFGSADEDTLKHIAEATGGQYYFASTSIDPSKLVFLDEASKDIEARTIELLSDKNSDGIPDYYNDLIMNGDLVISNHSQELIGIDFNSNADYDNDGLKNGQEIKIITGSDGQPCIKMISDPLMPNIDNDPYEDYDEILQGSDPFKYSFEAANTEYIMGDDNYSYARKAYQYLNDKDFNDNAKWVAILNHIGKSEKKEIYRDQIIDYFYNYSNKDSLDQNKMKDAIIMSVDTVNSLDADAVSILDKIKLANGYLSLDLPNVQKIIELRKEIIDLKHRINCLSTTDNYSKLAQLLDKELVEKYDQLSKLDNKLSSKIFLKIDKVSNPLKAKISNSGIKLGTAATITIDINEYRNDISNTIAAFAMINANIAAFQNNYDIISKLEKCNDELVGAAAKVVMNASLNESKTFFEVLEAINDDTREFVKQIAADVLPDTFGLWYINILQIIRDTTSVVLQIKEGVIELHQVLCIYYMTNEAIDLFTDNIVGGNDYYTAKVDDGYISKRYLMHVAQMRIAGEKKCIELMDFGWLVNKATDYETIKPRINARISTIRATSKELGLQLTEPA